MNEKRPDPEPELPKQLTALETYNLVSDTAGLVNFRKKDNLYQAVAIFVGLVLGSFIGFFAMRDRIAGVLLGGFIGLLVGLFGSGIFIMIYRTARHFQGKHD